MKGKYSLKPSLQLTRRVPATSLFKLHSVIIWTEFTLRPSGRKLITRQIGNLKLVLSCDKTVAQSANALGGLWQREMLAKPCETICVGLQYCFFHFINVSSPICLSFYYLKSAFSFYCFFSSLFIFLLSKFCILILLFLFESVYLFYYLHFAFSFY